ncbi:MAG: penicillin-binding protein 2 [Pseudomonadota bacterium]|nr:penicillin-binding protein 2 [Pseudomonadota bacterium]
MLNREEQTRSQQLTRRTLLFGGGQMLLIGGLVSRMYYLQIVQRDRYAMLSDDNRINLRLLAPARGELIDRFGVPLAINRQDFHAQLVSEQTPDIKRTLTLLTRALDLSDAELRRILADVKRKRKFVPVTVRESLNWDEVATLEANAPDLPGVEIAVGDIRHYPFSAATAHVTGYVGVVSRAEVTGDPMLVLPGFRIGKTGMEKKHDADLLGSAGTAHVEVNALGREIRQLSREGGKGGMRIALTLDIELQKSMHKRLAGERSASAVLMDVHTGAVYAISSAPAFDPNDFLRGITPEEWQTLASDPASPLSNKAIAGQYSPGSTFKPVTALAGLVSGRVSEDFTALCEGYVNLGEHRFHCWRKEGHGQIGMVESLAQSCDVFYYELGRKTGIDAIARMARLLGLDRRTGIDIPGERPGLVPDKTWKLAHRGTRWQVGDTFNAAIGQGFLQATPLQMAVMTARIVNGGFAVSPYLTAAVGGELVERAPAPRMDIDRVHLDLVKKGMIRTVSYPRGTAWSARINVPKMEMGGKTGTSQVRRITQAQRDAGIKNEDLPWRFRHHALFVGFAPVAAPRYACAVVVEHGGSGGSTAAPIARDILLAAQKLNSARPAVVSGRLG